MKPHWLLFFLIIFLSQCRKDSTQKYFLSDNIKKYNAFQIGSYWIYQNDSTHIIDSIYVDTLEQGFAGIQRNGNLPESNEFISCVAKSVVDTNLKIVYQITALGEFNARWNYYFSYCCDTSKTQWMIEADLWETIAGDQFYSDREKQNLMNPLSQFVVNGSTYFQVYNFEATNIQGIHSQKDIIKASIFIVKGIGNIKWTILYEDSSSVSWSLLRYHIVF